MLGLGDAETIAALRRRLAAARYSQSAVEGLLGALPSNREPDAPTASDRNAGELAPGQGIRAGELLVRLPPILLGWAGLALG